MGRRWWWLLLVPVIAAIGFVTWRAQALGPMPAKLSALRSDERVQVSTGGWLVFKPTEQEPATRLVSCPGGRVDPRSYAHRRHASSQRNQERWSSSHLCP